MPRKAFEVTVELDVQAVTCPGVWLCPTGKVTLRVCMLGSTAKTLKKPPVFPLLYHEKFIFRQTICSARFLTDLQRVFAKECLYAELVQWQGGDYGTVLATFESSLEELLYPSPTERGLIAGVDIDLLMEPAQCFPGILSPKIEVSTKTTIEEVVNPPDCDNEYLGIINPKMLSSKASCPPPGNRRQRKVCHSRPRRYHRRLRGRPCRTRNLQELRPPFVVRHVQDDIFGAEQRPRVCSPNRRCRRPRCRNCSPGPPQPVWQAGPATTTTTSTPSPCCSCRRDASSSQPQTPPCCCRDAAAAGGLTAPTTRSRSVSPPPRRRYEAPGAASTPRRAHTATGCKCKNKDGGKYNKKDGCCPTCEGYGEYFDVCSGCRCPVIPTKRFPQGCVCEQPKVDQPGCKCRTQTQGGGQEQMQMPGLPEPAQYGYPAPPQICTNYSCPSKCTKCLLNPGMAGMTGRPTVQRLKADPRYVEKPSYREAFYHTLEKFYKKLYKRARSRASEESKKY